MQHALNTLARAHLLAGELSNAALMIDEDRVIAEVTGNPPTGYAEMMLAAWRGQQTQASELIEATLRESTERGLGWTVDFARSCRRRSSATYASSVLNKTRPLSRRHWSGCPNARG